MSELILPQSIKPLIFPFHEHSNFSDRDGIPSPKQICKKHKELGFNNVMLTEHGTIGSAIELHNACEELDLKPHIAIEAYLIEDRFKQFNTKYKVDSTGLGHSDNKTHHITIAVSTQKGFKNLNKLIYLSNLKPTDNIEIDGFEGCYSLKPRITEKMLFHFNEGLIVTSGCRLSIFNKYVIAGNLEKAEQLLHLFNNNCENFFLELHIAHNEVEEMLFKFLKNFGLKNNIPMIPANDAHYIEKGHLKYWNFMSATRIRETRDIHKPITNDDFYIKSAEDIYNRTVELCDSKEEANKIIYEGFNKLHELLEFQWKDRKVNKIKYENDSDNLYKLLSQKLINYFGDIKSIPTDYKQQMRKEFDTLVYTGNASYCLLVYELLEWCKSKGIQTPVGRGSLPSMLSSFMLGISCFDPLQYGLLSERALSKERISEVDADLDFSKENVERIKNEYLYTKFGKNKVVNIVNYGEYKMSSSIRAVMKYLSIPVDKQNIVNKAIREKFVEFKNESEDENDETIEPSLKNIMLHDEFKQIFYNNGVRNFNEIMEYASVIEGAFSNTSVHASGLLISLDNIYEDYGTIRVGDTICSAYDMNSLKYMGALKLDLLSVNTYAKIEKTLKLYNSLLGV